ncbi:MAG: class I SAM-dependent methyltransferase [Deltaproteobacteria bacterium]|nr:class I SAM-dependent methyltransferase [Deltaproteobacteria bacterium]
MTLTDVREKWNRRWKEEDVPEDAGRIEPNPLVVRLLPLLRGRTMLDAACGMGRGLAALVDRYEIIYAVDLSDAAVGIASRIWKKHSNIRWVKADVKNLAWPRNGLDLVCAFGFTDWDFFKMIPGIISPGGMFLYQGFSKRQLEVRENLDPDWTSSQEEMEALFSGWEYLVSEESVEPPYRVSFAARKPVTPENKEEAHAL